METYLRDNLLVLRFLKTYTCSYKLGLKHNWRDVIYDWALNIQGEPNYQNINNESEKEKISLNFH